MSFVRLLGMADFVPEQVDSKSEVVIEKDGDGFSITSVHLILVAKIPGIDNATFQSIAMNAKAGCPVSKLMNVEIGFEATLASQSLGEAPPLTSGAPPGRQVRLCKTGFNRGTYVK
jgi:lipoyl-dependent peroxiredoxin